MKIQWSFTSLNQFEQCPWRYYLTRVAREIAEPETEVQKWGNYVHKAFENRVHGDALPDELKHFEAIIDKIVSGDGEVFTELKLAVDENLKPVDWKDGWCRGIIDLLKVNGTKAWVLDYKTGKRKPESRQLSLFAALVFAHYDDVEEIYTSYLWIKDKALDTETIRREQISKIWEIFIQQARRLEYAMSKNTWIKKPSGLCRAWCPVTPDRCEFRGKP